MPKYELDINNTISLEDYSVIHDYVSILEYNDNLVINIENNPKQEVDMICNLLENDHFDILKREEKDKGSYAIKAIKLVE